jgi:hypothetical protein
MLEAVDVTDANIERLAKVTSFAEEGHDLHWKDYAREVQAMLTAITDQSLQNGV